MKKLIGSMFVFLTVLVMSGCAPAATPESTSTPVPPTPESTSTPVPPTFTPSPTSTMTSTPDPLLGIGSTMVSEKDGMVLVYVPAGEFIMGHSNASDSSPTHQVFLDDFWIDQTEVTNAMYARCVDANQCNPPSDTSSSTHPSYFGNSEFENYPVVYVSWDFANDYCEYAGRRLPSEAEWEKAARGTDGNIFPWGNTLPDNNLLNYNSNIGDTTEVGSYPEGASIYGAFDMAGNVWEWVEDWYDDTYYANSPSSNPSGPETGQYKVLRGGAWHSGITFVGTPNRNGEQLPSFTHYRIGIRCALSP